MAEGSALLTLSNLNNYAEKCGYYRRIPAENGNSELTHTSQKMQAIDRLSVKVNLSVG